VLITRLLLRVGKLLCPCWLCSMIRRKLFMQSSHSQKSEIVSVEKHPGARRSVLPTPCCPTTNYYCMMNLTLMPPSALLSRVRGSWSLKKTTPPCAPCKTTSTTARLASVCTCSQVPSLIPRTAAVFCWWNSCRAHECARKWRESSANNKRCSHCYALLARLAVKARRMLRLVEEMGV
jgi:hypothetical protein